MRLFHFLPVLRLLLRARASSFDSREPAPHRLDVRDTSDVCTIVSGTVPYNDGPGVAYIEDMCICLSTVNDYLLDAEIPGQSAVTSLTSLVSTIAAYTNCPYPEYSAPFCSGFNDGNACDFECIDGFSPLQPQNPNLSPTGCVCNAPSVICNGQCVAAGPCPSIQVPSKKKRSWVGSGSCTDIGPGWVACGVLGAGPHAWECVNAARDLESCGGCTFPLTAYSPIGKDCSALPGVADVSCLGGECVVHRCLPGYMLAFDGMSCIRKHHISQSQFSNPEEVPARVYGLEHVPLGY